MLSCESGEGFTFPHQGSRFELHNFNEDVTMLGDVMVKKVNCEKLSAKIGTGKWEVTGF